jgi:hypothetical protein
MTVSSGRARDQEAVMREVTPFNLHGVTDHDVTLSCPDGNTRCARLGPESGPERSRLETP